MDLVSGKDPHTLIGGFRVCTHRYRPAACAQIIRHAASRDTTLNPLVLVLVLLSVFAPRPDKPPPLHLPVPRPPPSPRGKCRMQQRQPPVRTAPSPAASAVCTCYRLKTADSSAPPPRPSRRGRWAYYFNMQLLGALSDWWHRHMRTVGCKSDGARSNEEARIVLRKYEKPRDLRRDRLYPSRHCMPIRRHAALPPFPQWRRSRLRLRLRPRLLRSRLRLRRESRSRPRSRLGLLSRRGGLRPPPPASAGAAAP